MASHSCLPQSGQTVGGVMLARGSYVCDDVSRDAQCARKCDHKSHTGPTISLTALGWSRCACRLVVRGRASLCHGAYGELHTLLGGLRCLITISLAAYVASG